MDFLTNQGNTDTGIRLKIKIIQSDTNTCLVSVAPLLLALRKPPGCWDLYGLHNWEVSSWPSRLYKSWRSGRILLTFENVHSLEGWEESSWTSNRYTVLKSGSTASTRQKYRWYLVPIFVKKWTSTQVQTNNLYFKVLEMWNSRVHDSFLHEKLQHYWRPKFHTECHSNFDVRSGQAIKIMIEREKQELLSQTLLIESCIYKFHMHQVDNFPSILYPMQKLI
jgi:hypothetical protein